MAFPSSGTLRVYNTLTKKIEPFVPIAPPKVNFFVCGPTVYNFAHLGNAKTYTQFDFVVRYLRYKGFDVLYLQNITDIDDKIIHAAKERGIDWRELASMFERIYREDMAALGNTQVSQFARATDHMDQIVAQVQALLDKGFGYRTSNGIYFEIGKYSEYGKLSGRHELQAEDSVSRVDDDPEKRGAGDFCLWKAHRLGEPVWETPLGPGRPGWHIEDTAITEAHFGPQYDIHGGAVDLVFPHHEAEIAQMEAASGQVPLVRYWLHTGFLNAGAGKMSKSRGSLKTIRDALTEYDYRVLRFFFLSSHYRSAVAYSEDALAQAGATVDRLEEFVSRIDPAYDDADGATAVQETSAKIASALDDDFDTPVAFAALFQFIRAQNTKERRGRRAWTLMQDFNELFDIMTIGGSRSNEDLEIDRLIEERRQWRQRREFARADEIRLELLRRGIQINDSDMGSRWRRRPQWRTTQ